MVRKASNVQRTEQTTGLEQIPCPFTKYLKKKERKPGALEVVMRKIPYKVLSGTAGSQTTWREELDHGTQNTVGGQSVELI